LIVNNDCQLNNYSPSHIYYFITINCNQMCTKCSHWKQRDITPRLPTETITTALNSILTMRELCIVGGEPLLYKDELYRIVMGIPHNDVRTVIITNGLLMDREFVQKISLLNVHLVVSIDTVDREFWKFVTGTDTFVKVIGNLEYAIDTLSPDRVSIQSVLAKETELYIKDVSRYAKSKGIHHSIQNYISQGFDGSWTEIVFSGEPQLDLKQQCFATDRNLSFLQNGDVFTCFQQSWIEGCEKPLGNLNIQTMDEILENNYVRTVSHKMKNCNLPCKVLKCNTESMM